MPKGYLIAQVDVTDPLAYQAYVAANALAFTKYGAQFLVRGGQALLAEGRFRQRLVVLEFVSLQAATACYHSPEYARAMALRQGASVADIALVAGPDAPDPAAPPRTAPARAYWIVAGHEADPGDDRSLVAAWNDALARCGGRVLVSGTAALRPEGRFPARIAVIGFPSLQAATECYHTPDHGRPVAMRQGQGQKREQAQAQAQGQLSLAILPGYDGPQPGDPAID